MADYSACHCWRSAFWDENKKTGVYSRHLTDMRSVYSPLLPVVVASSFGYCQYSVRHCPSKMYQLLQPFMPCFLGDLILGVPAALLARGSTGKSLQRQRVYTRGLTEKRQRVYTRGLTEKRQRVYTRGLSLEDRYKQVHGRSVMRITKAFKSDIVFEYLENYENVLSWYMYRPNDYFSTVYHVLYSCQLTKLQARNH